MRMGTDHRQEKSWLVKSSTRILGPHSVEEVAQLLLKKHISIIDEVRQPKGRWKYIREHAVFNETVNALRAEQENSPELTLTQTSTQTQTLTNQTSVTRTDVIGGVSDDMTVTPTPPAPPKTDIKIPSGAGGVKEVTPVRETNVLPSMGRSPGGYGSLDDQQIRSQVGKSQKSLRWAILVLVGAVIIGVFAIQTRRSMKRNEGYEALLQEALRYRSLQLYEKSLASYKKASQKKEPPAEIQVEMAQILIVLDRQNVAGRRILEKEAQDSAGNRGRLIDASLGIAISYILEGSLREAEDTLQKILVLEPSNFNARLNLALISLRKGEWREADRQLEDLTRRHSPHPLVLLGRGVSFLQAGHFEETRARSLASEIESFLERSSQLRQELLMVQAALLSFDPQAYQPVVRDFLLEVSRQSNLYARDLRLDWRIANWEFLEKQCRQFAEKVPATSWIRSMQAVCQAEAGRDNESRAILDDALAIGPRDPVVLFTQANLLYRGGLKNEAFAVLRMPEVATMTKAEILLGRICLDQGDLGCAEKVFNKLLSNRVPDLIVTAGLADIYLRQGDRLKAMALIREGLSRDSNYLPLIELREAASGEI